MTQAILTHKYVCDMGTFEKGTHITIIHDWLNKLVVQSNNTKQFFIIHPFDSNNNFPIEVIK